MDIAKARTKQLASALFRRQVPRRAARWLAAVRHRSLVLLYHRIARDGPAAHEIVASLPATLFARQLETLARLGDIVPLARLLEPPQERGRPRFAITFDDDDASHVRWALPVLKSLGVPATFFLSGRTLHDMGPYWWTILEQSIGTRGLAYTCQQFGIDARTPGELADALQGTPLTEHIRQLLPSPDDPPMPVSDIRTLVDAGMTIGFHTLRHPVLTALSAAALETVLTEGRRELAAAAGMSLEFLAYPHGRANFAVTQAAERAGFRAAFTTRARANTGSSNRFLLGRWDPGLLAGDDFAAGVVLRLTMPATPRRGANQA